jgi:peptidoglycan-N-acetylglucosamine deacetylase
LSPRTHNVVTIDVEDWYHVCGLKTEPVVPASQRRVRQNTELILSVLNEFGIKATFFVLGCVAEAEPDLAPLIAADGHEIASHGYSHRLVSQLSPDEFRNEIRQTGALLQRQTGQRPVGFRAPRWSLSRSLTPWAFDILAQEGYLYDSSLNPLPFVGDANGPRFPYRPSEGGGALLEYPPLVASSLLGNLPVGGGWGFRLFPLSFVVNAIEEYNHLNRPAVLYLHPRELDPSGPRLPLSPVKKFAAYGTRQDAVSRLRRLFDQFSYIPMKDLASTCHQSVS